MLLINVREDYVINWDGPGWYADLGRSFEGKSYVEGAKIASFDEFDQDGYCLDPEVDGGYIWNEQAGRGTPYKLAEQPNGKSI